IPRSSSTFWRTPAISTWALEPRSTSAAANTRLRTRYGARRLMKAGSTRQSSSNNIGHRPGTGNCGTEDVLPSNKKTQPRIDGYEYSLGYPLLVLCFAHWRGRPGPPQSPNLPRPFAASPPEPLVAVVLPGDT